ncbi:hypothetical protein WICMUC_005544 [Wickerhamomyces mucosus]|uniref:L-type lectin-like domain-containing protein n=1 Tax=Wickerhamomyces mucosus TaxID=1378264 RepID=A0A9P8P7H2_9ASCO|nr:hypothetical protein WICMUC_005544 [Wickerhamomyces mucosus]
MKFNIIIILIPLFNWFKLIYSIDQYDLINNHNKYFSITINNKSISFIDYEFKFQEIYNYFLRNLNWEINYKYLSNQSSINFKFELNQSIDDKSIESSIENFNKVENEDLKFNLNDFSTNFDNNIDNTSEYDTNFDNNTDTNTNTNDLLEIESLSLPDLTKLDYIDSLSITDWELLGDGQFLDGRLILTPQINTKSSLINKNLFENSHTWTFELIFRSLNGMGKTSSGLSIKLLNDDNQFNLNSNDFLFGGQFDGINLVVDSNSLKSSSIHFFINDGSISLNSDDEIYNKSIGSCLINYQDSQVPNTLRIVYDQNNFLIVQINNKICLKTSQIDLSNIQNFKIQIDSITKEILEQFEILKLKFYRGLIDEVLTNLNKFADQPKIVKKFVQLDKNEDNNSDNPDINQILKALILGNTQIQNRLDKLELQTNDNINNINNDYDINNLYNRLTSIDDKVSNLFNQLQSIQQSNVPKDNKDLINHLREVDYSLDQLTKKLEVYNLNHNENNLTLSIALTSGFKYIFIIISIFMIILG